MGYLYNNGAGGKLPAINIGAGTNVYSSGFGQDPEGIWPEGPYNSNPTYTYRDNMTKIVGRHNLQFGVYFVAAQKNELRHACRSMAPSLSPKFLVALALVGSLWVRAIPLPTSSWATLPALAKAATS